MKKLICMAVCVVACSTIALAQNRSSVTMKYASGGSQVGTVSVGVGGGINSPLGILGIRTDALVAEHFMIGAGIGSAMWGYKASLSFYYVPEKKWCPTIGFSRLLGKSTIPMELEVVQNGITERKSVDVVFKPVNQLNLGIQKQWYTRRGNHWFIDLGYAVSFTDKPYELKNPSQKLTVESDQGLNFLSPGGIILGGGYCIKL